MVEKVAGRAGSVLGGVGQARMQCKMQCLLAASHFYFQSVCGFLGFFL